MTNQFGYILLKLNNGYTLLKEYFWSVKWFLALTHLILKITLKDRY